MVMSSKEEKNNNYSLFINLINSSEINLSGYLKGNRALSLLKKAFRKNEMHELKYFWDNIENIAGKFDDLDKDFKIELKKAAYFHIQEINNLVHLKNFNLPNIFSYIAKFIINFGWNLQKKVNKIFGQVTRLFGRKLYKFGIRVHQKYIELYAFTRYFEAPIIYYSWKYIKYNPTNIIQNYINQIPIDQRLGPVYKCSQVKITCCAFIGLDFLPSNGNLYFLESNFNPGHSIERHYAFENGDTVCHHLCAYAKSLDLEKIVFYPYSRGCFPINLEKEWKQIAKYYNVEIEIIDAPSEGSPAKRKSNFIIKYNSNNIIYINGRWVNCPVGRLIYLKGLLDKEIEIYNKGANNHIKINIPKRIYCDNDMPKIEKSNGLPNIILKNIHMDRTEGIRLFRADKLPQFNKYHNIAYEYLKRDLIIKNVNGRYEKYAYDYRTYLLLTPFGPIYAGAKKIVNTIPVPSKIKNGNIKYISPFVFNTIGTAKNEQPSQQEDIKCKHVTLNLGNVIHNFLREKHAL
jgi:hypothetical protein